MNTINKLNISHSAKISKFAIYPPSVKFKTSLHTIDEDDERQLSKYDP